MSLSPDRIRTAILPAGTAAAANAVRFDVDLRRGRRATDGLLGEERAAAQALGYAAGWAEGQRAAHEQARAAAAAQEARAQQAAAQRAAALRRALDAVATAASELERRAIPVAAEIEAVVLNAAVALTEAMLGHELAAAQTPGLDAVRRALALAPSRRPVLVRLHPDDHATLADSDVASGQFEVDGRMVTLLADPTLRPGDAVAECDATTVDARLGEALDRAREVLSR